MKIFLTILLSLIAIYLGYGALKTGIKAFRENDKGIGPYVPKMLFFGGLVLLVGVIVGLIRFLIMQIAK